MNILYLTFYFEPDLCAGSFRNTPLVYELSKLISSENKIHVITTMPNRYKTYSEKALKHEIIGNIEIHRIQLPEHKSGFLDQMLAYKTYFIHVLKLIQGNKYNLVFASSSRLFTAYLGNVISRKRNIPLYLDIRDIFVDTIEDVIKNRVIKFVLLPFLRYIENKTFKRAVHINLISGGFETYFRKYHHAKYSFFSNGIDEEFSDLPSSVDVPVDQFIITYAGNIGEGQGLHKVIPYAAKELGPKYLFRVIGDGGMKKELLNQISTCGISNVELFEPVSRSKLLKFYQDSHFLFLHLNDYKAFEKVLPSKLFEYGAFDKPIIAGVGGFSSKFVNENLSNCIVFSPSNVDEMVNKLKQYFFKYEKRIDFCEKYKRENINKLMAKSIYDVQQIKQN